MGEDETFGVDADGEERELFGVGGHVKCHEDIDIYLSVMIYAIRSFFLAPQRFLDVLRDIEQSLRAEVGREFDADIAELMFTWKANRCRIIEC